MTFFEKFSVHFFSNHFYYCVLENFENKKINNLLNFAKNNSNFHKQNSFKFYSINFKEILNKNSFSIVETS